MVSLNVDKIFKNVSSLCVDKAIISEYIYIFVIIDRFELYKREAFLAN